jgi:hypothetical protein
MLYDPTMKPETKADPLSLEGLIAWLEKQPAYLPYDWRKPRHCLIGQWLRSTGLPENEIDQASTGLTHADPFRHIALGNSGDTFGAALARARNCQRS